MSFKKLTSRQLFDGFRMHENKVLILRQDGIVENMVTIDEAGDDIEAVDGIICPGFINCHCHLELSHLKNEIPENTGLAGFVSQIVQKRNFSQEVIQSAITDADKEMAENGIVAVGDICNTTDTIEQKAKSNIYYRNFIEAMGSNPAVADKIFSFYETIYNAFAAIAGEANTSIVPHAPYSVSDTLWKKILHYKNNKLYSIHNQECEDENVWFENKSGGFINMFKAMGINTNHFAPSGKSSLQTYLPYFDVSDRVLLIHNVFTNEEDIAFARNFSDTIYWCLCPNANYYISRKLPNIPLLIKNDCNIVLGTDSLASNYQLSIVAEIKRLQQYFPKIALEKMLQWATINGAKALGIDGQYGSFENGKEPGLAVFK